MIGSASSSGIDFSAMRAEMKERMDARFEATDTDKSGGISLEEFKVEHAERASGTANSAGSDNPEELFSQLDVDGDGELTATDREQAGPPGGHFSPESFMALLGIQEQSGSQEQSGKGPPPPPPPGGSGEASDPLSELLSAVEDSDDTESNLIDELLETLTETLES